jgi:hypothetical protein
MAQAIGNEPLSQLASLLTAAAGKSLFSWQTEIAFITVTN